MKLADAARLDERSGYLAWAYVANPAQQSVNVLIDRHGAVESLLGVLTGRLALSNAEAVIARWTSLDPLAMHDSAAHSEIRIVTRCDPEWPPSLGDLTTSQPWALWLRGQGSLAMLARSVAVVGARACTAYGSHIARSWSAELAARAITVVSGGAFGIDAAAHRGAIDRSVCVTAGGVDTAYPRAHAELFDEIAYAGLIVSETPPGEQVRRERFLSRNRLIAALTQVTVIVEAADRSGSLNTARLAADLHRDVIGVPGPVTSSLSAGVHSLIRDHAAVLGSRVDDVWEALDPLGTHLDGGKADDSSDFRSWSSMERAVFDALERTRPLTIEELVERAGVSRHDAQEGLARLLERSCVTRTFGGWAIS